MKTYIIYGMEGLEKKKKAMHKLRLSSLCAAFNFAAAFLGRRFLVESCKLCACKSTASWLRLVDFSFVQAAAAFVSPRVANK